MSIAVMTIAIYGVEKDGCTLPITDGNCFCSAIANGTREPDNIRIFRLPVMEIIAPAEAKAKELLKGSGSSLACPQLPQTTKTRLTRA